MTHPVITLHATPANDASTPVEELFALVATIGGLEADNDCDEIIPATVGARCAGGCSGGFVADPHGPSTHNPTGLRECPVCG